MTQKLLMCRVFRANGNVSDLMISKTHCKTIKDVKIFLGIQLHVRWKDLTPFDICSGWDDENELIMYKTSLLFFIKGNILDQGLGFKPSSMYAKNIYSRTLVRSLSHKV